MHPNFYKKDKLIKEFDALFGHIFKNKDNILKSLAAILDDKILALEEKKQLNNSQGHGS